jgi:8-oxo-dGTP diphosphatase
MEIKKFNIRVYGIVVHKQHILVTDEFRLGMRMTKFPGGGLEFGEGTADCLEREFREEVGQNIEIKEHIYTTDYFQPTQLLAEPQQLISIYYHVELRDYQRVPVTQKAFDFREIKDGAQSFRWIHLADLKKENLTFPIDQKIVDLIKEKFMT